MLFAVALAIGAAAPDALELNPSYTLAAALYDCAVLSGTAPDDLDVAMESLRARPTPPAEPSDIAAALGLEVTDRKAALDDVIVSGVAVVWLEDPDAVAVLLGGDEEWIQLVTRPGRQLTVLPRDEVGRRFRGRALTTGTAAASGPRIRVEHPHSDMGRGYIGVTLRVVVTVNNDGPENLHVRTATVSCSCLKPALDTVIVPPDRQVEVPIELRALKLGPIAEHLWLYTNDPTRPMLPLSAAAEGLFGVTCYPSQIRLAASLAGGEETAVRVLAPNTLALTEVLVEPAVAEARIERRSEELEFVEYLIVLKATPGDAGTHTAALLLKTDHPDFAELRLPVHLRRR